MFLAFTAFSLSFVVISFLLLHKIWEIKKGKTFIGRQVLPKSDSLIKEQIDFHKEIIVTGSKKSVKALSSVTKESTKHFFLVLAHYLHEKLTKIILKMRDKGGSRQKNGVSFFLKRVEEYKEEKERDMRDIREVNDIKRKDLR